ncbi:hypothetical protein HPB50_021574 [Hyalomma asiaticum]|uniref:Uncharacterized protein n=1 Tax=Hyalomma asiaticum TaxID=266040 RepID=A0ACB7SYP1_HYAAI|nr:hypothetical protein HPB50_021574 [Hyalomma asiaticum]
MLALGSYRQLQRAGIDFVSLLEEKATVQDSRRSSHDPFDGLADDVYSAPVGSDTLDAASPGALFESNLSLAGSYDDTRSDIYQVSFLEPTTRSQFDNSRFRQKRWPCFNGDRCTEHTALRSDESQFRQ